MIVMAVAQHEGVEGRRIDAQKLEVVEQRLRREAEVDKHVPHLGSAPGFDVHRQAEFADDGPARRLVAERPAEALDFDAVDFGAWSDGNLVAVDDRSHEQPIHLGHRAGYGGGLGRLVAADEGGHDHSEYGAAAAAQDAPPMHGAAFTVDGHELLQRYPERSASTVDPKRPGSVRAAVYRLSK